MIRRNSSHKDVCSTLTGRLDVALSRVGKKLYVLTDLGDLSSACRDNDLECTRLAADLLIDFS